MTSEYVYHPYFLEVPVTFTKDRKGIHTFLSFYGNFVLVPLPLHFNVCIPIYPKNEIPNSKNQQKKMLLNQSGDFKSSFLLLPEECKQ